MADPELQELTRRAGELRSLADHIASIANAPHTYATATMKTWKGPHAERTRGQLKSWRAKCDTVAEALREEARTCDQSVKDARQRQKT
ncbi:hypothetical protein OG338_17445 [Streptomyces sp. NBC_00726]|uniref:hypothetical protein n=1 Tax=Streptomyces sp. NBC_00726 TaxID=2903674 RepID=UPI0038662274